MLDAWTNLQRIKREEAHLAELPVAQLVQLTANMNRDTKKSPKPYGLKDFVLFDRSQQATAKLSGAVAAVAMSLRREDQGPKLLVAIWQDVVSSLNAEARMPKVRALASDDDSVWILAPEWEGPHIRGGLVLVHGRVKGAVTVRDIDRKLIRHQVRVPERPGFGWVEANLLLLAAET